MAKYTYIYVGGDKDIWDIKGKTSLSQTSTQKDLEYLYTLNIDGIVRVEKAEPKAKE